MFQQVVGIPMGTNCAPLLADLFLYSYESRGGSRILKKLRRAEGGAKIFGVFRV
jgi:hypothetical protein